MPLSSGSFPSVGGSNFADIAVPSALKFCRFSASVEPKVAGGSERNNRPNRPWKIGEFFVDINPRIGVLCLCAMSRPPALNSNRENVTPEPGFVQNLVSDLLRRLTIGLTATLLALYPSLLVKCHAWQYWHL